MPRKGSESDTLRLFDFYLGRLPLKRSLRQQVKLFLLLFWLPAVLAVGQPAQKTGTPTVLGTAVYYNDRMNGRVVALKGERYDSGALTAATHTTFPLGSTVRVTNLKNHKSVVVRVNDRMNPRSKSTIDLSRKAAETIDIIQAGHARVSIELVGRPPHVSKTH
jgi:rare lipoprotein A (peptidoglycan hydrolase)